MRVWSAFARGEKPEARDQAAGQTTITYSNAVGGGLVPVEFFDKLPMAMAQHSPLFDEDSVTFIRTDNGREMQVPFASDVETVATVVVEGGAIATESDVAQIDSKTLGGFNYKSPLWRTSIEFDQDVSIAINTTELFRRFAADRIARGAGADLLVNSSAGKPFGLVPALLALGAITVAQGSAANTGGSETGANSVGSGDLAKLFFAVPAPYRASAKSAWLMNDATALYLSTLNDKMGRPLLDINEPVLNLLGKPVKIDNSMPNIGASQTPIAFGDLSYWATRYAASTGYILKFRERYAEKGQVAFRAFVRVDGCLMFSGVNEPSPIRLLQNHS
jgi:HK97 family phage major capsid protein